MKATIASISSSPSVRRTGDGVRERRHRRAAPAAADRLDEVACRSRVASSTALFSAGPSAPSPFGAVTAGAVRGRTASPPRRGVACDPARGRGVAARRARRRRARARSATTRRRSPPAAARPPSRPRPACAGPAGRGGSCRARKSSEASARKSGLPIAGNAAMPGIAHALAAAGRGRRRRTCRRASRRRSRTRARRSARRGCGPCGQNASGILAAPQRQHVERRARRSAARSARAPASASRARPSPGARKCSASQLASVVLARHVREVEPTGVLSALARQVGPVVAADAADLVAAATAERVEERLGLDQPGRADARVEERVDARRGPPRRSSPNDARPRPVGRLRRAARGASRTSRRS